MARKRIGTRLRNIAEAALQDVEDKIVSETRDLIGKSTAAQVEDIFEVLGGPSSRRRTSPAGVLGMMAADPSQMMEAGLDPAERQLALAGHGVQRYDELVPMQPIGLQPRATWIQLNLAKHQALLVQRIRVQMNPTTLQQMCVGLRWGRPAQAIGTGAPGHLSPGVEFTMPAYTGVTDTIHATQHLSDVSWTSNRGTSGGIALMADGANQEVNLAPNFVLIRSYCVIVGGAGVAVNPYINFFGKIVNLNFGNVLSVRR